MYIREKKTTNKKTGEIYVKHILVESVRIQGNPRQRTVMGLGRLDLPRREWKKLAHALEYQLAGQSTLLEDNDKYIEDLALSIISNNQLSKKLSIPLDDTQADAKYYIPIDPGSISAEKTRTFGAELVCQSSWNLLKIDQILKKCNFLQKEQAIAKALIFGRLISPGSERHTIEWYKKRSALSELPGPDITGLGKDLFYEIGDKLYENKEKIEELLFHQQETLFTPKDHTIFLYDLTNTHLEGSGLGNKLAARGRAKNKRTDCPLITLSLIVRNDGTPVASHIYKGSQSEPETMTDMLDRLEKLLGYDSGQMVLTKPTIIMDRGIATKDNIALLQERFYQYIVVTREDQTDDYLEEFKTAKETFLRIDDLSHKYTAYGDESHVYVKKIEPSGENICKILCLSDGKSHKENAIAAKKDMRYLVDIENLNRSIQKGSIKNIEKIEAKLNGHNEKHKIAAKKYNTVLLLDEAGRAQRVEITAKDTEPDPLSGCYVIESTHKELDAEKIWRLYMTQTRVEDAFRSLKDELGVRPIYHHNEVRTCAHLFITVLAYHILSVTERRLALHNDTRQWKTLRDVLSTHTRVTVVMRDKDDNIYHHRVTSKPEDVHQDIYKKLEIKDPTKNVVSCFK